MSAMSGIDVAGAIAVDFPDVTVLILTMFAALRAGARGYVLRDAERDDFSGRSAPSPKGRPSSAQRSHHVCWTSSPDDTLR